MSGLQIEPVINKGLGEEFANTKAKYRGQISLRKDATTFQTEIAAILDCVTGCLRERETDQGADHNMQ